MQVGSLVVSSCKTWAKPKYDEKVPVADVIYTVRDIERLGGYTGIRLEEIRNRPGLYDGKIMELMFSARTFREVQPPMTVSIEEILSETNH